MGNATREKIKKHFLYIFFCLILFLALIAQSVSALYSQRETFFSTGYSNQYDSLKKLYYNSQYVIKKDPGIIPDQALESFAAGAFLEGINPINIIHDQPPLGRYILSLSILIFDNVNTIMVFLLSLSVLGIFLLSRLVMKNTLLSLLPLGISINEPLWVNKFFNTPLLEPIQLTFIIFALYFFIKGIIVKKYIKWFILTSLMLGFVVSTRFFILGVILALTMILYFMISRQFDKKFILFLLTLPIGFLVLLASYAKTLQLGSSIVNIFGIQKYIFYYHKAQLSLPFSFWDLLMFNKWHTWWGDRAISSDVQWIIIWPIAMVLTLVQLLAGILKKVMTSEAEKIITLWVVVYSLFLSMGETSTRYFSPLLPFIYILAISFLMKMVFKFRNKWKFIK
ncbi:MAG: glycosyltransferase family 39 protein [Candidatus Levybacteria bacterium]|nr:glycosyltransferase family 39 protein [Candidatus Levybacteria bacterium]